MTRPAKMKAVKAWGGFVDGKLNMMLVDTGFGGWGKTHRIVPAIFKNRKSAREEYQDVRPVQITELRRKR